MSSIIKVDTIQNQSGANIISESSNTITVGASGDTITVPSGATLGGAGTVDLSSATVTLNSSMKNTPAFLAYSSTNPGTALVANTATKVIFDAETFDTDSAYSTATGLFTVPSDKAGKYFCLASIGMQSTLTNLQPYIYKNTGSSATEILRGTSIFASAGSAATVGGIFDLAVGDTLSIYVIQANTQSVEGITVGRVTTYFCAYRLIGA